MWAPGFAAGGCRRAAVARAAPAALQAASAGRRRRVPAVRASVGPASPLGAPYVGVALILLERDCVTVGHVRHSLVRLTQQHPHHSPLRILCDPVVVVDRRQQHNRMNDDQRVHILRRFRRGGLLWRRLSARSARHCFQINKFCNRKETTPPVLEFIAESQRRPSRRSRLGRRPQHGAEEEGSRS